MTEMATQEEIYNLTAVSKMFFKEFVVTAKAVETTYDHPERIDPHVADDIVRTFRPGPEILHIVFQRWGKKYRIVVPLDEVEIEEGEITDE